MAVISEWQNNNNMQTIKSKFFNLLLAQSLMARKVILNDSLFGTKWRISSVTLQPIWVA